MAIYSSHPYRILTIGGSGSECFIKFNKQPIWYWWTIFICKKRKVLINFNHMIADMIRNKKLNPIVNELFIRDRKLNISLVFIIQSYFKVPKEVRLNSTIFYH